MPPIDHLKSFLDQRFKHILYVLFGILICIYCYTALTSFGYDDEYFNIRYVTENKLVSLIRLLESTDIHPPLAYIFNYIIFKFSHNWSIVRLISSLLYLSSLAYLLCKTENRTQKILLILLLGLNPTALLWCTSVRWYAYATPLLIYVSVLPNYKKKWYWVKFFSCFLVFAYMEYVGVLLMIPYFIYYWLEDKRAIGEKIKKIFLPGLAFTLLYIPQLIILFKVHIKNNVAENQQTFDLKTSIISTVSSTFSNQGIFPLSLVGIISMIGMCLILLNLLILSIKNKRVDIIWFNYMITVLIFLVTGLAGKVRNLILLEPSRNLSISTLIGINKNVLVMTGLICLLIGNIAGVRNVLLHQQTTKNSWNIPFDATIQTLKDWEMPNREEVYFTHSPSFTFQLMTQKKEVISLYNTLYFDSSLVKTTIAKLAMDTITKRNFTFLITYRGNSITSTRYADMIKAMNTINADSIKQISLGYDNDYKLKRRFFFDYPEYEVTIIKYYGIKGDFNEINKWEINSK